MTLAPAVPDLDECAREPIHIPGAIQPHGVLLVIDPADGRIVQASANAHDLLGVPRGAVTGQRHDTLLDLQGEPPAAVAEPRSLAYAAAAFPRRTQPPAQPWVGRWHLYPQQWQLELEPRHAPHTEVQLRDALPVTQQIARDVSVQEACHRVARQIRALLGYDRVMVYRFDDRWNGDVVAEASRPGLEAYLGLHYPASDIPAQARALYLRNRVRQIADVGYTACPIEPALHPRTGQPADLSDVSLRSVSPVHLEYLGNMGVGATLVTSIVVAGRLWGLVACHHYAPLFASHGMRELADALTRALSSRIGLLQAVDRARGETALLTVREKLITAFDDPDTPTPQLLAELAPDLMDVVDADGVAIFHGDQVTRLGPLPDPSDLLRLRQAIEQHRPGAAAFHAEAIAEALPAQADLAPLAAGFIYMPLAPRLRSALLWTRREQVEQVNWAGNPQLSKLQDIPHSRLSPRKSFDLWQETVRGRARPWSVHELHAAESLRVLIALLKRRRSHPEWTRLESALSPLRQPVAIIEQEQAGQEQAGQEQAGQEQARWRVAFANAAFAHASGVEVAELLGRELVDLCGGDAAVVAAVARLDPPLRGGQAPATPLSFTAERHRAHPWLAEFEPLPGADGPRWLLRLRPSASPGVG